MIAAGYSKLAPNRNAPSPIGDLICALVAPDAVANYRYGDFLARKLHHHEPKPGMPPACPYREVAYLPLRSTSPQP